MHQRISISQSQKNPAYEEAGLMFCPYVLIFIPLVSVKTMSSFVLTVR